MKNWRLSTNISLYFENDTKYGQSYNGRRIGTRMLSIYPMTLNDLKRLSIFFVYEADAGLIPYNCHIQETDQ